MNIGDRVKALLRRQPPTDEELAARAEARRIRDQMRQDRLSQESAAGQVYRSGRR